MKVKNIIKKVANLTNNADLVKAIDNNQFSTEQQKEINLLVDCVNLTSCNIATNYVKIYEVKTIKNNKNIISFSDITKNMIYDIVSVKNPFGKNVEFTITANGIIAKGDTVSIKYSIFPTDVDFEDDVNNFPIKVAERNFVYGVLSEYLYAKGVFDEALVWEERFKNEMINIVRVQKSVIFKNRRWQ